MAALSLVCSCNQDRTPEEEHLKPVLSAVTEGDMIFTSKGGNGVFSYTVTNPTEEGTASAATYGNEEWIQNIYAGSTEGEVHFTVAPNDGQERSTVMIINYEDASPITFNVRQYAAGTDPELTLSNDRIETFADGGSFEITYQITKRFDGASVTAEVPEDGGWVTGISTEIDRVISFDIEENSTGADRSTVMSIRYGISEYQILITQYGEYAPDLTIEIDTVSVSESEITWSCIPSDKKATYISMISLKSAYDSYSSEEELIEGTIAFLEQTAISNGLSLEEYLAKSQLNVGDRLDFSVSDRQADTEYVIFAFGLSAQGQATSGVFHITVRTDAVREFSISYETHEDYGVDMTVIPIYEDRYYWYGLVADTGQSKDDLRAAAWTEFDGLISELADFMDIEDLVDTYAEQGEYTDYFDLYEIGDGVGDYIGYAVYVDAATGGFSSELTIQPLTVTGE